MAAEIVPGYVPNPPESIDPENQARACSQRARACMRAAQYAREDGGKAQALIWLEAARMSRIAAAVWRERAKATPADNR